MKPLSKNTLLEFNLRMPGSRKKIRLTHFSVNNDDYEAYSFDAPAFTGLLLNTSEKTIRYELNTDLVTVGANHFQIQKSAFGQGVLHVPPGTTTVILIHLSNNLPRHLPGKVYEELAIAVEKETKYSLPEDHVIPPEVALLLDRLYKYGAGKKAVSRFEQRIFLFARVLDILSEISKALEKPEPSKSQLEQKICHAKELLANDVRRDWTLDLLALESNLSRKQLTNGFRKFLNISPIQFLYEERLRVAGTYLQKTDLPIGQITELVGYHHSQNFSQAFSKMYGKSPREYRGRDND